jgi:hypothetical protein
MEMPMQYRLRMYKAVFAFFTAFCSGVLFLSCNYFTEPEPFVNKQANSLEIESCPFRGFTEGQRVSGAISVFYIRPMYIVYIDHVNLFVDSTLVGSKLFPWDLDIIGFNVDTRKWPDGKHTLFLNVYNQPDSVGLLRAYSTTFIFDQNQTTPANVSVVNREQPSPNLSNSPTLANSNYHTTCGKNGRYLFARTSPDQLIVDIGGALK